MSFQKPLVSLFVGSDSVSLIRNELKTFGLNPRDWRAERPSRSDRTRLILVHCEDSEVRLAVNVRKDCAVPTIQDVEWLVV